MLTKFTYKKLAWVDMESPSKEDVRGVMTSYDLHPLIAEELLTESVRPKVDFYDGQIYLVLHFPTVNHSHNGKPYQEIDFVIGRNYLLTVHYETVDPLLEFSKMFEVNSILEKSNMGEHAGYLFFYIMRELYSNLSGELFSIKRSLAAIENKIFSGDERTMVRQISEINRKLINFRQAIRFHKDVLASFEIAAKELFGEKYAFYSRSLSGECFEIVNILDGNKDMLDDLWKTNDSLLSSKSTETMKTLTIFASILLPATLISQLFSVSTSYVPFMDRPFSFLIIISLMVLASSSMYFFSKLKRWI